MTLFELSCFNLKTSLARATHLTSLMLSSEHSHSLVTSEQKLKECHRTYRRVLHLWAAKVCMGGDFYKLYEGTNDEAGIVLDNFFQLAAAFERSFDITLNANHENQSPMWMPLRIPPELYDKKFSMTPPAWKKKWLEKTESYKKEH